MLAFIWFFLSPTPLYSKFTANNTSDCDRNLDQNSLNHRPKLKAINIPNYFLGENEDSIDLQIKSLLYNFNRFKIHALKPFLKLNNESNEYEFDYFEKTFNSNKSSQKPTIINNKLDVIYNIDRFKQELLDDPYRILIDYSKNKFRSMLILSEDPKEVNKMPALNTPNFNFLILKPNDTEEKYIDVIINKSGIYGEHRISNRIKIQILLKTINKQKKSNDFQEFNKDDKAKIIRSYVQKLAFHIQVERIYKASLKSKERDLKNSMMKFATDKSIQSYKSLRNERSRLLNSNNILRPHSNVLPELTLSPSKLNSNLIIDLNSPDQNEHHYYSDTNSESQASSSASSTNFTKLFTQEEKNVCFEQSKMAVRIRIERERNTLF